MCTEILAKMDEALDPLTVALKESQDAFTGSEQERDALDKAYKAQIVTSDYLTQLEEQMVPDGYVTPVPPQYSDLPQLKKRATVEMVFKKGQSGAQFNVNGVNYPEAKLVMIIDGYTGTHFTWIFSVTEYILHRPLTNAVHYCSVNSLYHSHPP